MSFEMVRKEEAADVVIASRKDGSAFGNLDYFGRKSGRDVGGPEAWFIELHDRTLGAHFHSVDQFQVLLGGEGSVYQRTPVEGIMVQYADAYSTYGPLVGEEPPLRILTLRRKPNEVTGYMPRERFKLAYRGRRHQHMSLEEFSKVALPAGETKAEALVSDESDGLLLQVITCGPGATFEVDAPTGGAHGQFHYVANGSVEIEGDSYGAESIGWQWTKDGAVKMQAGPDGCRVLVFRFPEPSSTLSHGDEIAEAAVRIAEQKIA